MKNIKYLLLGLLSLTLLNCNSEDDNGQVVYNGASLLTFLNQGGEQQVFVVSNTFSNIQSVRVGTLAPVSGSHTVKLVPDLVNSTAVLGEDYVILNDTDVIEDGQTNGEFRIEFFKEFAIQDGKKIFFTLESDLTKAVFNNKHTVNVNLSCPVQVLEGLFKSTTHYFPDGELQHTIVQPRRFDTEGNPLPSTQLLIKDFWTNISVPPGGADVVTPRDFILNYDQNYVINSFSNFNTGFFIPGALPTTGNSGQIRATPHPTKISRFNACTRVITLEVRYLVPRLTGGFTPIDVTETFTGIDLPTPEEPEVP